MKNVPFVLKYLFSSKLRVTILSHFFFHPGELFHVRSVAGALHEPAGTVGRELAHLEKAGILISRRVGNQKQYELSEDSSIIEDLRNIFLKTSGASFELQAELENTRGVELVFLYGSYAAGEAGPDSDIDIMVVGEVSDRQLAPVIARIEKRLKREINHTIITREEAKKRLGKRGDFIHEVFSGPKIVLIGNQDDGLLKTS